MARSGSHHHTGEPPRARGPKRHRTLLVAVAAALALGWLAWNVLLVESEVGGAAADLEATDPATP